MTNNYIIHKKDCLDTININNKNTEIHHIHPLFNFLYKDNYTKEKCYILPQLINNKIDIVKDNIIKEEKIRINSDLFLNSTESDKEVDKDINPLLYFTLPINSNNFLELVFNISNSSQLNQWINLIESSEYKLLEFVLNLYWKNYYNKIDEEIDSFIIVNKKIFKKFYNKDITDDILLKIITILIKKKYGEKIKYISKFNKYLIKYI